MAIDKRFECLDCGKMVMWLGNHGCTGAKKKEQETRHLTSTEQVVPLTAEVEFNKRKEPKSTERTKRFRERHGEAYKAYMQNYMRKWRSQ